MKSSTTPLLVFEVFFINAFMSIKHEAANNKSSSLLDDILTIKIINIQIKHKYIFSFLKGFKFHLNVKKSTVLTRQLRRY